MEQWYALYTKPHAEYQVASVLERRGIYTYLPEIGTFTMPPRREKEPFFPCYLFVRVDFNTIDIAIVQWTPGLRRIISFGQQPVPVPAELIRLIRYKLAGLASIGRACPLQPGELVRITEGPCRDILTLFDRPTTPGERVRVWQAILGRLSRAQVNKADLVKAPSGPVTPEPARPRRTRGRGRIIKVKPRQPA